MNTKEYFDDAKTLSRIIKKAGHGTGNYSERKLIRNIMSNRMPSHRSRGGLATVNQFLHKKERAQDVRQAYKEKMKSFKLGRRSKASMPKRLDMMC